ncbi:protein secretion LspG pseudopilin, type II [Candidatus Gastranaerophilus sp. (ex Termes propinquus)]|nr:protein secretion LspG pseudopilin, type II [Candidatus Gastranaerophilus sp. (ex Termes propinquus)]
MRRERERESKKAFTLAEILITLAIVGIVAASTIPAVVTNLQRQEYVTRLQKAYNTLTTAVQAAEAQRGPVAYWPPSISGSTLELTRQYINPHLSITADCGSGTVPTAGNSCFAGSYKNLAGNTITSTNFLYYELFANLGADRIMTSDGISFAISTDIEVPVLQNPDNKAVEQRYILVDVNGPKPPNQLGRDLFVFTLHTSESPGTVSLTTGHTRPQRRGVVPFGTYTSNTSNVGDKNLRDGSSGFGCNSANTNINSGGYCAAKVLAEGAMNY